MKIRYEKQAIKQVHNSIAIAHNIDNNLASVKNTDDKFNKILGRKINEKINSDIDIDINSYWVFIINSSASGSAKQPDATSATIRISKLTKTITENYKNCNYDKERLRQFQSFILKNKLEVQP